MKHLMVRKKRQYIFIGTVVLSFVVAILSFLAFYLPARSGHLRLTATIERLEGEVSLREKIVGELERRRIQLESAQLERQQFLAARIIPRKTGFAAILPSLEEFAQVAGIDRNRVQFQIEQEPRFGVYAVGISMPVRGDYKAVTRFIRELESSNIFFILNSISMDRAESETFKELNLLLSLTTFFSDDEQ